MSELDAVLFHGSQVLSGTRSPVFVSLVRPLTLYTFPEIAEKCNRAENESGCLNQVTTSDVVLVSIPAQR